MLFKKAAVSLGISVRSESHDLVFVRVEIEAQMQGDQRIQNSDRAGGRKRVQQIELAIAGVIDGNALHFANGVQHDDQAFGPTRCKVRAGGVR